MRTRKTLDERVVARQQKSCKWDGFIEGHIRTELDRLARQVRDLRRELESLLHPNERDEVICGRIEGLNDVLDLIKRAKQ